MPAKESSRVCSICGNKVVSQRMGNKKIYCSRKCNLTASSARQSKRRSKKLHEDRPLIACPICGKLFKHGLGRKYCSDECRNKAKSQSDKRIEYMRLYREENIEKDRERARNYMRERRANDADFRKLHAERARKWKEENPDKLNKIRENYNENRRKFDAHIKLWRAYKKSLEVQYDNHVKLFNEFKSKASPGWLARYYKRIGMPWRNPCLSVAARFRVRYALDQAFRLKEINRNTWRKNIIRDRTVGVIDYNKLIQERSSCPYCGLEVSKCNSVVDHMDPIKLGGMNAMYNLTICCRECNTKKAAKPFDVWVDLLPEHRKEHAMNWYEFKRNNYCCL